MKRLLSLFLCVLMLASTVLAAGGDTVVVPSSGNIVMGTGGEASGSIQSSTPTTTRGAGLFLHVEKSGVTIKQNKIKTPENETDESFGELVRYAAKTMPDDDIKGVYLIPTWSGAISPDTDHYVIKPQGSFADTSRATITSKVAMLDHKYIDTPSNELGAVAWSVAKTDKSPNVLLPVNYWTTKIAGTSQATCREIVAKLFSPSNKFGFVTAGDGNKVTESVLEFIEQGTSELKGDLVKKRRFINYCALLAYVIGSTADAEARTSQLHDLDNMCSTALSGNEFEPLLLYGEVMWPSSLIANGGFQYWWRPKVSIERAMNKGWEASEPTQERSAAMNFLCSGKNGNVGGGGLYIYGTALPSTATTFQGSGTYGVAAPLLATVSPALCHDYASDVKPLEAFGIWGLSMDILEIVPESVGDVMPVGTVGIQVNEKTYEKSKGSYNETFNVTVTVDLGASGTDKDDRPITSFAAGLRWLALNNKGDYQPKIDIYVKQAKALPALDGAVCSDIIKQTNGYYGDGAILKPNSDGVMVASNTVEGGRFTWENCVSYMAFKDPGIPGILVESKPAEGRIVITIQDLAAAADYFADHSAVLTFTGDVVGNGTLDTDTSKNQHWFKVGGNISSFGPASNSNLHDVYNGVHGLRCTPKYDYSTVTAGPSDKPYFYSTYQQPFSEFKQGTVPASGTGSSEQFNSMTGTPTFTETTVRADFDGTAYDGQGHYYQYFASGGSEFVVQFDGEYIESANASRTYTAAFNNILCDKDNSRATCGCVHMSGDPPSACGGHCACDHHSPCQDHYVGDTFTWQQQVTGFSYVKITNIKVWKLSEARLDGTRELLNTNEVKASVSSNPTTVFYNIAASNNSASGRLVYSYNPTQHDSAVITGYPKTSDNSCSSHTSNNQKTLDGDTAGVTCEATCVSDFIVLRTSHGDQSILYYEYKSKKPALINKGNCVAEPIEFDKVPYATIWTGNSQTSKGCGLPKDGITYGGYNGNFGSPSTKYASSGHAPNMTNLESTTAYQNKSGAFKPTSKPSSKFLLVNDKLKIPDTKQNGEYVLGNSEVFYENIINYSGNAPIFPIVPQSHFGNKKGFVVTTTYSAAHPKINDVVVYNPVSTQNSMIISLPNERDQRVIVPAAGGNPKTDVCPGDASCPYLKNQCTVTSHIHTEACYKKVSYDVKPPFTLHQHTASCPYHTTGYQWYHTSGCSYSGQTHNTTSSTTCTYCGHGCGYLLSSSGTKVYDCGNQPLNAYGSATPTGPFNATYFAGYSYASRGSYASFTIPAAYAGQQIAIAVMDGQALDHSIYSPIPAGFTRVGTPSGYMQWWTKTATGGETVTISGGNTWGLVAFVVPAGWELSSVVNSSSSTISLPLGSHVLSPTWGLVHSSGTCLYSDGSLYVCRNTSAGTACSVAVNGFGTSPGNYNCATPHAIFTPTGSTLETGQSKTFNYTGGQQSITLEPGTYTLEVWGAQGGRSFINTTNNYGQPGNGGYSKGTLVLGEATTLYINVGGQGLGNNGSSTGGYNGGGAGFDSSCGSGGGATHIATTSGQLSALSSTRASVLLVAGGGGGTEHDGQPATARAGDGGGLTGQKGLGNNGGYDNCAGNGGTQTAGGTIGTQATGGLPGSFGQGGASISYHSGGGGGGWYGGASGNTNGGGGGGSGYVNTSLLTNTSMQTGIRTGNGMAKITAVSVKSGYTVNKASLTCADPHHAYSYNWKLYTYGCNHKSGSICSGRSCTDTTPITFPTQEEYTIAQCAAGYIVKHASGEVHLSTTNNGVCSFCGASYKTLLSSAQATDRVPDPSEYGCFEYGDIRCWAPCGNPANHRKYVTEVTSGGATYKAGNFINLDWGFQVLFPNTGDFYGTGSAASSTTSAERGKGYTNNMDCTIFTKTKWIEFPFAVLYNNQTFKANERIYLEVPKTVFDFYVPLHDYEVAQAEIKYGSVSINAQNGETLECGKNSDHNLAAIAYGGKPKAHHHNADKRTYIDVVGRIGSLTLEDTGDFRFSNFFKQTTPDWLVKNIVHKVDFTKPNLLFADQTDVRGVALGSTGSGIGGNTYGTKAERAQAGSLIPLPISPASNNVTALQRQPIRIGYDCYFDLTTLGNYYGAPVRGEDGSIISQPQILIKPHYFRLDLDTGAYTGVDVYIDINGDKKLINDFDGSDAASVYDGVEAKVSLNWRDEQARRNYSGYEPSITNSVAANFDWVETPKGSSWEYGNYNVLNLTQRNRTFIGTEKTYGWDKDPSDKLPELRYSLQGSRWHFNVGLPSSACFILSGQAPSLDNIKACANGKYVVFCALEIYAQGEVWTLGYDGSKVNKPFHVTPGDPGYDPVVKYPASVSPKGEEMPIVAIFSIDKSSKDDLNVTGTH